MKDEARRLQLLRREQPQLVTIAVGDLKERVSPLDFLVCLQSLTKIKAKEHDIQDCSTFLRSKLFAANGYKLNGETVEKRFAREN